MENKKNVPAIRFKGFTDIWIKRSFGEVEFCCNEQTNI